MICPPSASSQIDDPDQPFRITALPSVDENLFALRLLSDIYANWPALNGDRSNLRKWFSEARRSTSRMQGQIRMRRLDSDLEVLFQDCLDYMSATESYLSSLDLLENQKNSGTAWDFIASIWDGYKAGSDANSTAQKLGLSDENAANAGKLIGAANAAANFYTKSKERDAGYRAAVSESAGKLEDRWNGTLANLKATAHKLTAKYGWAEGEAGFDGFQSPQIHDLVARSPRDPFLKARYGDTILRDAKTPNECIAAANAYLEAAQLVPSDGSYASLRLQYVAQATAAGLSATAIEAGTRGYVSHPSTAPSSLKLARTYLTMDGGDASANAHVQLARALAFSGRYQEAAGAATDALRLRKDLGDDAYFCYRYAKLMSLTGNLDLVNSWIEKAYHDGFHDIAQFRDDPDLEAFRSQRAQQFQTLTTIHWSWEIKYGFIWDDVIVKNSSPFDMTNVQVQVHIRKGSSTWDPVIKCSLIKAGSTCERDNVMSITGDAYDTGTASLTSDQS
jgi:hypothetical protein